MNLPKFAGKPSFLGSDSPLRNVRGGDSGPLHGQAQEVASSSSTSGNFPGHQGTSSCTGCFKRPGSSPLQVAVHKESRLDVANKSFEGTRLLPLMHSSLEETSQRVTDSHSPNVGDENWSKERPFREDNLMFIYSVLYTGNASLIFSFFGVWC